MLTRRQVPGAPALLRALPGIGDDLGCELSCYGDRVLRTPQSDALAAEGTRFTQFHATAPVGSANRSASNVGLYQTTTGTQNHRSRRKVNFQARYKGPAFLAARRQKTLVDPAKVELSRYYRDHRVVRDEVANYLDAMQSTARSGR